MQCADTRDKPEFLDEGKWRANLEKYMIPEPAIDKIIHQIQVVD